MHSEDVCLFMHLERVVSVLLRAAFPQLFSNAAVSCQDVRAKVLYFFICLLNVTNIYIDVNRIMSECLMRFKAYSRRWFGCNTCVD